MRPLPTLFVGLAAAIGATAMVAAGPLLPVQRLESHAAVWAAETAAWSEAGVADVARAGEEPESAAAAGAPAFREPFYPIPPSAVRDPVPWRSPPLRRGIASFAIIDAMTQLVAQDSIDAAVVALEGFHTRRADLPNAWLVADDLAQRFSSFGADSVFLHSWTPSYAPNVIAIHRGTTRPREIYLIGGHFDSISYQSSTSAPGADDNASGTAAVLECARVLCQYRFESTLQFAAWSAEEFGLLGSKAYASHIVARGDSLVGIINVDMLGFLAPGDRRDLDLISNGGSDWLREVTIEAAALHVPALRVVQGHYPGTANSDQASFWMHGFSAISFFEDSDSPSPFIHTGDDVYLNSYNDPILAWQSTQVAVATLATLAVPLAVPVLVQDFAARAAAGQVELEWVLGPSYLEVLSVGVERAPYVAGPWTARTRTPLVPEPRMRFVDTEAREEPAWYRLALYVHGGVHYAGPLAIEPQGATNLLSLAARDLGRGQPVEIRYAIGRPTDDLQLGVFDIRGRRVRLVDSGARPAGTALRYWDRLDDTGRQVTRGVYFVLLDAGATRVTRKLVVVHE